MLISDEGAKDVMKSIISSTLVNLSVMLPMMLSFVFIRQYIVKFFGTETTINFGIVHFIGIVIILIMYLTAKKDIGDLSATVMSDVTVFEHIFSHSVPKGYAALNNIILFTVMLFIYEYRPALALFWVVPVAYLIFYLSKNYLISMYKKAFNLNREVLDEFQESINLIQEIKAYNRVDYYINNINKKYDMEMKQKKKIELIPGTILNISVSILKLGMATVAVYGAKLLINNEIGMFTYLSFLIIAAVILNPVQVALMNFGEMMYLDSIVGRKDATDEEVKKVATIAKCDEFIEKLPEGYHTLIGENGAKLSGGERQRISIARALLKDAPIILLDESTASIDAENESKIQAGISELIKNKTVIIIAHRMRTVIDADKIIVLKDGKVAESGNSKELIERNRVFANMYKSQMQN